MQSGRYSIHLSLSLSLSLILQVDGVEVTSLTTQEVLSLLTGPEETVSLLLYREPSETLL
jgi:hypothetical protein